MTSASSQELMISEIEASAQELQNSEIEATAEEVSNSEIEVSAQELLISEIEATSEEVSNSEIEASAKEMLTSVIEIEEHAVKLEPGEDQLVSQNSEDQSTSRKQADSLLYYDQRCKHCKLKYAYPEVMAWHLENCHGSKPTVNVLKISIKHHRYQCIFCKKKCKTQILVMMHLRQEHNCLNLPFRCGNCDNRFIFTTDLMRHECLGKPKLKVVKQGAMMCRLCDKYLKSDEKMEKHVLKFHVIKQKKAKCGHCDESFQFFSQLKTHCQNVHPGEYFLQCEICKNEFIRHSSYQQHKKLLHGTANKYQCKICPATFNNPYYAKVHTKRIHTTVNEEKTWACSLCSSKFKCEEYLKRHIKCMHINIFLHCAHCVYKTRIRSDLVKHLGRLHFKPRKS